jgi:glycosyltransferase involved in cell wall biosynthesis
MISICIPGYHAARFLPETLNSVKAQSFSDWELIVVEDGSNDGTEAIVKAFSEQVFQRVRYLRHENNSGLTATRNTAAEAAENNWLAILDADDLWESDHLAKCAEVIQRGEHSIVHGGSVLFDSDSGQNFETRAPSDETIENLPESVFTQDYIIQPSSVVLEKSLWKRVGGFNTEFQHVEDLEMWLRCLRAGARIGYSGRITCRYRKHRAAMSAESYPMAAAFARVYQSHLDWDVISLKLREERVFDALMAAGKLSWRTDPGLAERHFRDAWRTKLNLLALAASLTCKLTRFIN